MFILYVMLAVSTYSTLNGLQKFIFFSSDCNPKYLPHEVSSLIDFLDMFVTRQLWVYITIQFFWPTKSHIREDDIYVNELSILEDDDTSMHHNETHNFDITRNDTYESRCKSPLISPKSKGDKSRRDKFPLDDKSYREKTIADLSVSS